LDDGWYIQLSNILLYDQPVLIRQILLMLALGSSVIGGANNATSRKIHFKLSGGEGAYALSSKVEVSQPYYSERNFGDRTIEIIENTHTKIFNISAAYDGQVLDSKWIKFHYPRSEDLFVEPGRIHEITFPPDVKRGDTISYVYEQTFEDPSFFPLIYIPAVNVLARYEVIVDHPPDISVDFDFFYTRETLSPLVERNSPTRTTVVFQDLSGSRSLPVDPFPWLHAVMLTKLTRAGQPINPFTPAAFAEWYLGLLKSTSTPSQAMTDLLAEHIQGAKSHREKARILFDYVKSNIRYIADEGRGHAFVPHPCAEVLEKKWGDCKDKARLLTVLASIHGVPLHLALVNTKPSPDFESVNIGLFNHVICVLEDDGELIFMDPTASHSEMGDPPDAVLLMKALLLDEQSPRYVRVPNNRKTPDLEIAIESRPSSAKKSKAKLIMRHTWRMDTLHARKMLNQREFETYLINRFEQILPKLAFANVQLTNESRDQLVLEADADLSGFFI
jgi:hypothetical protein